SVEVKTPVSFFAIQRAPQLVHFTVRPAPGMRESSTK
ncbi:MAG: hypothetical protein JWP50_2872, partial [Phenylobacterium sp.]|nr:hypothetical protein [Phenylobacterium sp.]